MYFDCCFCDFNWQTFWTAIGAITAIVGIVIGGSQWQVQAFNNLQRIFTDYKFAEARKNVFNKLIETAPEHINDKIIGELEDYIGIICRKMDEFCHPTPLVSDREKIERWWNPIGKAWGLLQGVVEYEREKAHWTKGKKKWREFERMGEKCLDKFPDKLPEDKKLEDFKFRDKAKKIKEYFDNKKEK